jgi:hypothetical protein
MATIHVNGNKLTTSNVDEAKSILNNLFPMQVAFIEDEGKVLYSQNMNIQQAKDIFKPKKVAKKVVVKTVVAKKTTVKAKVKVTPKKPKKKVVKAKAKAKPKKGKK